MTANIPVPLTIDVMVQQYVKLRDQIKKADDEHKKKLSSAREYLEVLNNSILAKLTEIGADSTSTTYGTAYRTMRKSATIADAGTFRSFVIDNGAFDLVDWKANANAVEDFIKDQSTPPPGVNYSTSYVAGIRRS